MTRQSIGGRLDTHALARLMHRPDDPAVLAREAASLVAIGLTYDDVAACLGLTKGAVMQLLATDSRGSNEVSGA